MSKKILHGILVGILSSAVAFALAVDGRLQWIENRTWDFRVRSLATVGTATDSIRLILVDQHSLDWVKTENGFGWPWPRTFYEPILGFCKRAGVKSVTFDILFSEPSSYGVDDDETLAKAIGDTTGYVQAFFLSNEQGSAVTWPADTPNMQTSDVSISGDASLPQMLRASFPIPEISAQTTVLANSFAESDSDAIIRRILPFVSFDNRLVPSVGIGAFLAVYPETPITITRKDIQIGNRIIPLDSEGCAILRYRGPTQTHKAVNAAAVIQSELRIREGEKPTIAPSFFKDSHVFVGVTAPALLDLKPTPISAVFPGVEIQATVFDNLLSNDFMKMVSWPIVILATLLFSLLSGIVGRLCTTGWQNAMAFVVLLPLPFIPGFIAYEKGYWLPVAVQEVGVAMSLVVAVIMNYTLEGRQKRFIKTAFRQYLSPIVIDRLVKNPNHLSLGGELRELSIYFSDVQNFTTISESLTPDKLTALLNEYLTAMTNIILDEGGTVDKYEGDAIIAFWNAPLDLGDHAIRAVRAALRCQKKLAEIRPDLKARYGKDLFARIGLNTGQVVVGNMGSNQRFDYTFLGDAGNLAARLEGINKQFGTFVMISEYTLAQLNEQFAARELSKVRVVGKAVPVTIYEPMFKEDYKVHSERITTFTKGLHAYYDGNFKHAMDIFMTIKNEDPPAAAYIRKCSELMNKKPEHWDGVWVMTEK
ncbi:MAG: adenylate/guanylate cyclase domain-containing protein [Lentisphaerae bacterium]|nr:adenylate/guanylate cyclase domain-containing protein [Lentisphaerota bacterium]